MMTTLDIDEDVLAAMRVLAARRRASVGRVISELVRPALATPARTEMTSMGFEVFSKRGLDHPITLEEVNRLRDESP